MHAVVVANRDMSKKWSPETELFDQSNLVSSVNFSGTRLKYVANLIVVDFHHWWLLTASMWEASIFLVSQSLPPPRRING